MIKYRSGLHLEVQAKDGGWIFVSSDIAHSAKERDAAIEKMEKSVAGDGMKYRIVERLEVITESEIYL